MCFQLEAYAVGVVFLHVLVLQIQDNGLENFEVCCYCSGEIQGEIPNECLLLIINIALQLNILAGLFGCDAYLFFFH